MTLQEWIDALLLRGRGDQALASIYAWMQVGKWLAIAGVGAFVAWVAMKVFGR